jgi:hypothetical protein
MIARYGAHHVVWVLYGDGVYTGETAPRWKRLAREILAVPHPDRISTIHATGRSWTSEEYVNEPWFAFNGYQSGHAMDNAGMRWMTVGPPSKSWRSEPHCPAVNMEPNYEGHYARREGPSGEAIRRPGDVFTDNDVRRAFYWSLLVAPPAGVTYGGHGIWSWETSPAEPLNHPGMNVAPPWHDALHLPGSMAVKHLKALFATLNWWRLRPAQALLESQPGETEPAHFVALAVSDDGAVSLAYLPRGGSVRIRSDRAGRSRWFNPATGRWTGIRRFLSGTTEFLAPNSDDWVLWRAFDR